MVTSPALHSATKTADKNNGGQALDLLTIALKIDSNKAIQEGILKKPKILAQRVFCIVIADWGKIACILSFIRT